MAKSMAFAETLREKCSPRSLAPFRHNRTR
jgi:hypothetical protein